MVMDAHGGYLWVLMWVLRPKDMVGRRNGAWGAQVLVAGREFGHAVHAKYTNKAQQRGDTDGRDVDGWTCGA